jgi:SAM-dependent methyltransferase
MMILKPLIRKIDNLACSVSWIRVFYLLRSSAFYLLPSVRNRINENFTQVRSTQKMDPTYDLSLYDFFKKYIQLYYPKAPTVMMDLGSGDGVIHAVNFVLHDQVNTFYLVDEFMFPQIIHSKVDEYLKLQPDRNRVYDALSLIKTSDGSLREVPGNCVDVVISTSLFEHVLRKEVPTLIAQVYSKLKEGGVAILSIDLRDHYDFTRPFFFYRYPEWLWKIMTRDRSRYMNRLRTPEFVEIFKECGFKIINIEEESIDTPLPKRIAAHFRRYSTEQLQSGRLIAVLQK